MSAECYMDGFFEKYEEMYLPRRLYSIPAYLLINKQGKIVNFDTPRSSKEDILHNEIQALLDKKYPNTK